MIHLLKGEKFGRLTVIMVASKSNSISKHGNIKKNCWECLCDCGKTSFVCASKLKSGSIKSCGCATMEANLKPKSESGYTGLMALYHSYKNGAIKRNISFNLTIHQFKMITGMDCHYCGSKPEKVFNPTARASVSFDNGRYTYNGIDRFHNWDGYHENNSLPCCSTCNRAKSDLSYVQFDNWVRTLSDKTLGLV